MHQSAFSVLIPIPIPNHRWKCRFLLKPGTMHFSFVVYIPVKIKKIKTIHFAILTCISLDGKKKLTHLPKMLQSIQLFLFRGNFFILHNITIEL